jgi:hypothetical protein
LSDGQRRFLCFRTGTLMPGAARVSQHVLLLHGLRTVFSPTLQYLPIASVTVAASFPPGPPPPAPQRVSLERRSAPISLLPNRHADAWRRASLTACSPTPFVRLVARPQDSILSDVAVFAHRERDRRRLFPTRTSSRARASSRAHKTSSSAASRSYNQAVSSEATSDSRLTLCTSCSTASGQYSLRRCSICPSRA